MSVVESKKVINNNIGELKTKKDDQKYGVLHYFVLHSFALTVYVVIDNYLTYGIIKTPLQLNIDFLNYLRTHSLDVLGSASVMTIQILTGFGIEKSLAYNYVPERIGLICHGINFCLPSIALSISGIIVKRNRMAGHLMYAPIGYVSMKIYSYIFENKQGRDAYKAKKNDTHVNEVKYKPKKIIPYPESVTLKNLAQFVICTGSLLYDPPLKKAKRTWREILLFMLKFTFLLNLSAFMTFQYVVPELPHIKPLVDQLEFLQLIRLYFKVVLPVVIIWMAEYYYCCFVAFLGLHSAVWGFEGEEYVLDWWNAANFTEFWSLWNYHMHKSLKLYVFIPLLNQGYSKLTAAIGVALFSGVLHDFLLTIPMRCCYGLGIITMLSQIPLAILTTKISNTFGRRIGNFATLFLMLGANTVIIFVTYYSLESRNFEN